MLVLDGNDGAYEITLTLVFLSIVKRRHEVFRYKDIHKEYLLIDELWTFELLPLDQITIQKAYITSSISLC